MNTEAARDATIKQSRGRSTRDELVAAAAAAYSDVGFDGASLREIAKRAGVTHVGLLYHFPNREALLAAVLERRDALDADRLNLQLPPALGPLDRLIELATYNEGDPSIVELYVRLAAEATSNRHPARAYFCDHYRLARAFAAEGFRQLRDEGRLRDGVDPDVAAVGFIALMDGLQVQWLTDRTAVDLKTALRQYVDLMLDDSAKCR